MKRLLLAFLLLLAMQLQAQDWQTNLDTAKKLAKEKQAPIILVFQGSDWCAPCIRLDRNIWSTEDFKSYAKDHYVMLKADFPRKKENQLPEAQQTHNKALAENYNPNGYFPLVVVLDAEGKVQGKVGFEKMSPKEYIQLLNSFSKN
ncbi:Thioredoxin-related protein [Pustulibacterium marinum]|uniref:Thioredoxin-related protein n=1 Tax=Pustulibacterium marinum TaxID=1224947 RepID=A0A1I7I1V8_9FLAO|nr:thioredoxin family protein [Pustulibacterium marinum]SFU66891.1 Thioredoxin-related protein [Pustulibacterium marinum]